MRYYVWNNLCEHWQEISEDWYRIYLDRIDHGGQQAIRVLALCAGASLCIPDVGD